MTFHSTKTSDVPHGQDLLEKILEVTSDGVFDWHVPSGATYFNAAFFTMLGYEVGEFASEVQSWRERVHPEDQEKTAHLVELHFADPRKPYRSEFRMRQKDGSWKWILSRGKVVEFEPDGSPRRMIGTHIDISERKRAQDRYQQLFENLTTGFVLHEAICDSTGRMVDYRFLEVNPAYEKLTGLKASEVLGKRVLEILPGVESYWIDMFGKVVATGESVRFENFTAPLERWYETWAYRPSPGHFAVLVTDITERKRQEEALRRSEEHFRFLAQNSIDIILRLSPRGEYLWASPSMKTILDLDPESVVGTSALAMVHPEDTPLVLAALKRALEGTEPQKAAYRHIMESGRILWLESIGKALRDPVTGKATEVLVATRDITEAKESERKIRELGAFNQQMIDTTGGIIVVFDDHGVIRRFNHAAEDLLGWKESEVLGRRFFDIFTPQVRREEVARLFPGEVPDFNLRRFENDWLHRDGSTRWIAWANTPILGESGAPRLIVCTGIDRTEYKLVERKILDLNESLERRVTERTKELQGALDELESFSYTVSHDLRSPLRAIDGFSTALLEEASDLLGEEAKSYLQRIRSAANRMARLIDDLLDLSRSSRHTLQKQAMDASQLAREILEGFKKQNPKRKLSDRIESGIILDADPILLRSIMENLLGNAWKYTAIRADAFIDVSSFIVDGRKWLQVKDNGVGFDMDHADKLFGTFQRLHSDPRFEGNGIGLATARKLVERHGGSLTGSGTPDQGATFRFTLDPTPSA